MELEECKKRGMIRSVSVDAPLIQSLKEMAAIKEKAVKDASITEETISAYVSLAYDALREILEAICLSKGKKILNHVCLGAFLQKELGSFEYDDFDRLRYVRNSINYYGKQVGYEEGSSFIEKIFAMKRTLEQRYLK